VGKSSRESRQVFEAGLTAVLICLNSVQHVAGFVGGDSAADLVLLC